MNALNCWDDLYRRGASLSEAAATMSCSRRTAASELGKAHRRMTDRAFRYRHAQQVARVEAKPGSDVSNWPLALQHLAQRIAQGGQSAVTDHERATLIAALPRSITVRR